MERRPDLGFDSYDRLFPSQDTVPEGGFGNLIALPLQKASRDKGNNVFLDDRSMPWTDQWAFLAGLHRIDRLKAERIGQVAERRGRILVFGCRRRKTVTRSPGPRHRLVAPACRILYSRTRRKLLWRAAHGCKGPISPR